MHTLWGKNSPDEMYWGKAAEVWVDGCEGLFFAGTHDADSRCWPELHRARELGLEIYFKLEDVPDGHSK